MDSLPQPDQPAASQPAVDDALHDISQDGSPNPQADSTPRGAVPGADGVAQLHTPPAQVAQPQSVQSSEPAPHWLDWTLRAAIWIVLMAVFAQQAGGPLTGAALFPVIMFALFTGGFLVASVAPFAGALRRLAQIEPTSLSLAPLFFLIPYTVLARLDGTFEATNLLTSGILLYLPGAIAIINTPQFRRSDLPLGLITVATPLVMPFTRNESIDVAGLLLRVGAFLLPVLLLLLTNAQQKQKLNFLFVCAVLSVWYAVEFNAFPRYPLSPQMEGMDYFRLALFPLFLYLLAVAGQFQGMGLSFRPTARGLSIVASNLILLAVVCVPIGLISGFLKPAFTAPAPLDAALDLLIGFVLIALPAEILFRGTIFRYLEQTLGLPQASAVVVSSIVFGLAHLNNPLDVGWAFVLATIAGIFYARTYIATRNVVAPAVVHTVVNWLWGVAFSGHLWP